MCKLSKQNSYSNYSFALRKIKTYSNLEISPYINNNKIPKNTTLDNDFSSKNKHKYKKIAYEESKIAFTKNAQKTKELFKEKLELKTINSDIIKEKEEFQIKKEKTKKLLHRTKHKNDYHNLNSKLIKFSLKYLINKKKYDIEKKELFS